MKTSMPCRDAVEVQMTPRGSACAHTHAQLLTRRPAAAAKLRGRPWQSLLLGAAVVAAVAAAQAAPGEFSFSAPRYEIMEPTAGTVNATITVERRGGSDGVVSVSYCCWAADSLCLAEGTRTIFMSNAYHNFYNEFMPYGGVAHAAAAGTLTWTNGEAASKAFAVTIRADAVTVSNNTRMNPHVEGTETLLLRLFNPQGGAALGCQALAELAIHDAEAPAAGVLHFTQPRYFVNEPDGRAIITVRRSGGSRGRVSVTYAVNTNVPPPPVVSVPSLPIARDGSDFTAVSGVLTWEDGDVADKQFAVPILNDGVGEGPELANLELRSPTGGAAVRPDPRALLTIADDDRDFADVQMYNMNCKELRIWIPRKAPIRGLFMYMPGSGGDSRWIANYKTDWKAICTYWGCALMGQVQDLLARSSPAGAAQMWDILRVAGGFAGRPELANAPYMLTGYSLGGLASGEAVQAWPDGAIGWAGYMGGNNLTMPPQLVKNIPGLFIAGEKDNNAIVGYTPLRNMFTQWRTNNLPVSYAIEWGVAHKDDAGQAYEMGLLFLHETWRTRYPTNRVPGLAMGDTVPLNPIDMSNGWYAQTPSVGSPVYYMTIGPETNFAPDKTLASWMPTEAAAMYYRAFTSVHSSYRPSNYPAEKPFQSPGRFTAPTPFAIYSPGAPVDITFDWRAGEQPVNTVTMYYETEPIALLSNAPWATVISNPPSGPHGITATAALQIGTEKHSFQIFTVQTPDAPERPTELCAAPHAAANIKLAWRDNANDEAGFLIERRPADCFTWEPVATVDTNVTAWLDAAVIAGSSYVYRVFAFNHNGRSRLGNEAGATAGAYTWAGRAGNADWTSDDNWLDGITPSTDAAVVFPRNSLLSPYTSGRTIGVNSAVAVSGVTFENDVLDAGGLCINIAGGADLQVAGDGWFRQSGAAANVLSGAVALAGGTVGCDIENGALTFAGNIAGAAALAKSGAGTLVLAGSNSYSGGTWIEAGRVLAVGAGGSACGTGPVHVGAGALLGGNGTILGVVSNAGVISPGASTGTLSMAALVQGPDAVLRCELGARGHDQLDVAGDVHLAGTLQLQNASNLFGTFTLISYGGTLTMDELTLDGLPGDVEATLSTGQVGSVTLSLTPEPAGATLLLFAVCAGLRQVRAKAGSPCTAE